MNDVFNFRLYAFDLKEFDFYKITTQYYKEKTEMSCNPEKIALDMTVEKIAKRVAWKVIQASMKTAANCGTVSSMISSFGLDNSKNDFDVKLVAACNDLKNSFDELAAAIKNTDMKNKKWYEFWKDNNIEDMLVSYILSDDFGKVMKRLSIYVGMGDKLDEYRKSVPELEKKMNEFIQIGTASDNTAVEDTKAKEYAKYLGAEINTIYKKIEAAKVKGSFDKKAGEIKPKLEKLAGAYDKIKEVLEASSGFIDKIKIRCTIENIQANVKMRGSDKEVPGLGTNGLLKPLIDSIREEFGELGTVVADLQSKKADALKQEAEGLIKKLEDDIVKKDANDYKDIKIK